MDFGPDNQQQPRVFFVFFFFFVFKLTIGGASGSNYVTRERGLLAVRAFIFSPSANCMTLLPILLIVLMITVLFLSCSEQRVGDTHARSGPAAHYNGHVRKFSNNALAFSL